MSIQVKCDGCGRSIHEGKVIQLTFNYNLGFANAYCDCASKSHIRHINNIAYDNDVIDRRTTYQICKHCSKDLIKQLTKPMPKVKQQKEQGKGYLHLTPPGKSGDKNE